MPTQEDCEQKQIPGPRAKVWTFLAPREQPHIKALKSLEEACRIATMAGIVTNFHIIYDGVPGFHNTAAGLAYFLQTDYTHFFFGADDVIYPPDVIIRLVNDDKDMVCGIYRKRNIFNTMPANAVATVEEFMQHYNARSLHQAEFCSGHTTMVKRRVVEKLIADYPELKYKDPDTGMTHYGVSIPFIENERCYQDDWALSLRAKRSGFTCWNDFGVRCKHYIGDFLGFEAEDGGANGTGTGKP